MQNYLVKIRVIAGLLFAVTLTGCTGMKDDSSCTIIDGVSTCQGINDINAMVENGDIWANDNGEVLRPNSDGTTSKPKMVVNKLSSGKINEAPRSSAPRRIGETVLAVTIFPYLDERENYHDSHVISTILTRSKWSLPHIEAINQSVVDYH